jgi:hypothetical protein
LRRNVPAQARSEASPAVDGSPCASDGDDVSISKSIPLHDLTNLDFNAFLKHRPADNDGVNLSVLSARINFRWKLLQQVA